MKIKKAFTLAELLVSVLIIATMLVILAPVITKRSKDNLSVTVDRQKGLEIYTNPGLYTFFIPTGINTIYIQGAGGGGGGAGASETDTQVQSFTSNNTHTSPSGVNKVTLKIIGSGGGGGAGNGATTGATSCENNPSSYGTKPNTTELSKYPLMLLPRLAGDGADLCMFKRNAGDDGTWNYSNADVTFVENGTTSSILERTCWYSGANTSWGERTDYPYSYNGGRRTVCTHLAGLAMCNSYGRTRDIASGETSYGYRLPSEDEINNLGRYANEYSINAGEDGLQLCSSLYNYNPPLNVPVCANLEGVCSGSTYQYGCTPYFIVTSNSTVYGSLEMGHFSAAGRDNSTVPASVRCVRELKYYTPYNGAGGASGAVMEQEINVAPGDRFEITIGDGGDGGVYSTTATNGISSSRGNGKQGETTKVVHKRGSSTVGTYYVKGGFGGYGAKDNAHASAIENGASSNKTTPNGTCYANNSSITCNYISYSGNQGTDSSGGSGGRVLNTGNITSGSASSGGYLYVDTSRAATQRATDEEIKRAKGQNATEYGFGGGGGYTPNWATGTEHFYQGGKGARGKVEISYKIALPGGGGGSAARVGGKTAMNEMYEIKYNVANLDKIVFKVGSGGTGGVASQDGLNGSATVVGDNEIVFLAGEGGKTATNDDKNNIRGGRGGNTSYINEDDEYENVASGVKIKNTSTTTYTYKPNNSSFKGENGKRGGTPSSDDIQSGYSLDNTIFEYGFNGGMGASPFGIADAKIGVALTCGGGNVSSINNIALSLGLVTNINYLCASGNTKGNSGLSHDPVNNEFGGSGGGGGGVTDNSFELGSGGNGSSGYLRIRWDMAEND